MKTARVFSADKKAFIGTGPFGFTSPEPRRLCFGVNDLFPDNNVNTSEGGFTFTIVPEPSIVMLAAIGLVGLAAFGWRRLAEFFNLKDTCMKSFHFAAVVGVLLALSSPVSNALGDQLMLVHVFPTDLSDNPITSIQVGNQYKLRTEVQDIRDPIAPFPGVFAAAGDINFDSALSSIDVGQTVEFGSFFDLLQESTLVPGEAIGYAATMSNTPPGNAPQFLFSVVLTATNSGTQVFLPSFSTDPLHENLLYGFAPVLTAEEMQYVGSMLTIVPEPSTVWLGAVALVGLTIVGRRRRKR